MPVRIVVVVVQLVALFFSTRPPRLRMARISHNRLAIFAFQSHHKMQNPSGTAYSTNRHIELCN